MMKIDYSTPNWTLRDAAEPAGYELNTLRSFYTRGHFRIIGGEKAKAKGHAGFFNLRAVMHLAVARALIDVGVHPAKAFEVSIVFAHFGDEDRAPAGLFDIREHGETLFVYWPDSNKADVIASDDIKSLYDLRLTSDQGENAALVIRLNPIEARVFHLLEIKAK